MAEQMTRNLEFCHSEIGNPQSAIASPIHRGQPAAQLLFELFDGRGRREDVAAAVLEHGAALVAVELLLAGAAEADLALGGDAGPFADALARFGAFAHGGGLPLAEKSGEWGVTKAVPGDA